MHHFAKMCHKLVDWSGDVNKIAYLNTLSFRFLWLTLTSYVIISKYMKIRMFFDQTGKQKSMAFLFWRTEIIDKI